MQMNLVLKNDPWKPILMNLLALELLKPDSSPGQKTGSNMAQLGETLCYYHAGIFTYRNDQDESISTPFHLSCCYRCRLANRGNSD